LSGARFVGRGLEDTIAAAVTNLKAPLLLTDINPFYHSKQTTLIFDITIFLNDRMTCAQRMALPACGRAEIRSEDEKKLEARKILENAAESHTSGVSM